MLELAALGRVHGHHLHPARVLAGGRLLLAQPGVGDRRDRARELARGGLRRPAHVGGREVGELGEVDQPLDDLGGGGEEQLPADPEPLDEPVHVEVRARRVDRVGRRAVQAQEVGDAIARLGRDLGRLERGRQRGDHVELAPAGDLGDAREVDRAQLDRRPRERAHDRAGVAGVDEQAQPGEQVAHLGALEEGRRARQVVGDGALLEGEPDRLALAAHGAHEHADVLRRRLAAGDQTLDLGGDRLRLRALGGAAPEGDLARGRVLAGFDRLRQPFLDRLDDRGGRLQQSRAGAHRGLQAHLGRSRPLAAEAHEVLRRGAAEAVDGGVVVARRGDVAVVAGEPAQQQALGEVRVLELVDEHVAPAARDARPHVRALAQQPEGLQDEVAVVERPGLGEHPVVGRVDGGELALARGARPVGLVLVGDRRGPGGVVLARDELRLEPVDAADDRAEQRARVAAQVVVAQRQLLDALEQHGEAVGGRDRRRERVEPGLERLVVQQSRAEGLEGGDGQLLVAADEALLEALAQRVGRAARVGEHEDRLGREALGRVGRQPREALGEHVRLARPGAADDEQRTARVLDRGALRRGRRRGHGHLRRIRRDGPFEP